MEFATYPDIEGGGSSTDIPHFIQLKLLEDHLCPDSQLYLQLLHLELGHPPLEGLLASLTYQDLHLLLLLTADKTTCKAV